jgi:glycosyltransferase involved in cell wall biosynthesis
MKLAYFAYPHRGGTFSVFRHLRAGLGGHGTAVRWLGVGALAHAAFQDPTWRTERGWGKPCGSPDSDERSQAFALAEAIETGGYHGVFVNVHADPVQTNLVRYLPRRLLRILIVHNITPGTYAAAGAVRDHVNSVIGVSRRIEEDLVSRYRFAASSVCTIPNATDLAVAAPRRPPPREALRILSLGRVEDQAKGVLWLPDILRRLPPDCTLTVAGDGPDLPRLRQRASDLGNRVRFRGAVSPAEVPALLAEHDVLLAPSRFEGFMITAVEAMAMGCVPVASRIRGVTDTVIDEGESGLLFPVGDLAAAAAALQRLDADHAFWLGLSREGQARVRQRFGVDRLGEDYARLIDRLCRAPPSTAPSLDLARWSLPPGLRPGLRTYLPTPVKNFLRTMRERAA